ncbi:hypothetical protein DL96DRAFT_1815207 [Flagelloscypha sp. PMI_526]|nr:hypothetical protein DL96DRAFT_1815207 [Flagelloscypha sp. PMI_526]
MVAFGKFAVFVLASVSSTLAAPINQSVRRDLAVTGITSEGGSPFGSIPSKLFDLAGGLLGGLFGRDLTSADIDTINAILANQRRDLAVTGIVSEGGSPFGSIPSKLFDLAGGLLGGLFGRDLTSADIDVINAILANQRRDLAVTGITSEGGSPFGSIPSKLFDLAGGLLGGLFGRDLTNADLDVINAILANQRRDLAVTGITSEGGSPFGSIPSKLFDLAGGLLGGLFGRDIGEVHQRSQDEDLMKLLLLASMAKQD